MNWLTRIIFLIASNLTALWTAGYFIKGFEIEPAFGSFLSIALLLTAGSLIVKPVLKLVLSPLIIITLGLFTLVINAGLLFAVDVFSDNLYIQGLAPLAYATLLITGFNIIFGFWRRRISKKD